jgi:uncharacterized protein (DUF4213/DUF364 family)
LEIVPTLQKSKEKLILMVDHYSLRSEVVTLTINTLSSEQAIGSTSRPDFALLEGKEVMIESKFRESYGQAFTNQPQNFNGILDDVLNLDLDTINNRAIFIATMNAVCSYLKIIGKVRHCRNEEPDKCGYELANKLINQFGKIKVGMVGYQPAILENLTKIFGTDSIRCSDLDPKNIGTNKFGISIYDGSKENKNNLIDWCDLLLVTGSTHVNNTFDDLYKEILSQNKSIIMFGVTGAGIAALLNLNIICPMGHQ